MDVLIKDLSDELHRELVRRAASSGMSLRTYLRRLLAEHVATPSMADWMQGLRDLGPAYRGEGPTGADLVASSRAEDDGLVDR